MEDLDQLSKLMPELFLSYKDINSVNIDMSTTTAKLCAFKGRLESQGRKDAELPCKACELADKFREQDQLVINSNITQHFLNVAQYSKGEWKIMLGTKKPIYDDKNHIMGVFCYSVDLSYMLNQLNYFFKKFILTGDFVQYAYTLNDQFSIENTDVKIKLTVRESESLFLITRGKTVKESARILQLAPRTVEQYVEKLRYKFNCRTKSELISKAMEQGFMDYIPPKFLVR